MATDRACADLALKGEQLCRQEQWEEGVACLESAIRLGTSDLKTLSAVYSQLGNAYFNFQDYHKALEYHQQDLSIARSMGDKLGEAKACSNIGSALKALNQFDEAVACYRIHLDISRELQDKVNVTELIPLADGCYRRLHHAYVTFTVWGARCNVCLHL